MWEQAREIVQSLFFKDTIELYALEYSSTIIGEDIETPVLVGEYPCNIESNGTSLNSTEVGQSLPHSLRISTLKSIPLDKSKTYKVKITQARLNFDSELLKVDSWIEAQISTVLTVSREVAV